MTVADNVLLPAQLSGVPAARARARLDELLAALRIEKHRNAYPARLSGGERQRVAIARALVNRPPLLLADEPDRRPDRGPGRDRPASRHPARHGQRRTDRLPPAIYNVYSPAELVLLALTGLVIAVVSALAPATWATRARTATALRTE